KCEKPFAEAALLLVLEITPSEESPCVSPVNRYHEIRQQVMKRLRASDYGRVVLNNAERLNQMPQVSRHLLIVSDILDRESFKCLNILFTAANRSSESLKWDEAGPPNADLPEPERFV